MWVTNILLGQDGDDVLTGGNNSGSGSVSNQLFGDSQSSSISFSTLEGDDRLISGNATDEMWGDWVLGGGTGGIDSFVFAPGNGQDVIHDFEVGKDFLDLRAFDFASINDLQFTHDASGDLRIDFADGGSITFTDLSELQISHDILI